MEQCVQKLDGVLYFVSLQAYQNFEKLRICAKCCCYLHVIVSSLSHRIPIFLDLFCFDTET